MPAVMTLVDGPTEESDNLICVAYRHQFDVVNESTGEAFRLHHVEASRVSGQTQGQVGIREDFELCEAMIRILPSYVSFILSILWEILLRLHLIEFPFLSVRMVRSNKTVPSPCSAFPCHSILPNKREMNCQKATYR